MSFKSILFALLICSLSFACKTEKQVSDVDEITSVIMDGQNIQSLLDADGAYPTLSEADCYEIQKRIFLQEYGPKNLAGYKAALTSAGSQKLLNTDHPAAGFLYKSGWRAEGDTILKAAYTLPFIEMELGYYTNTTIDAPLPDVASLKNKIASVFPVIEFPDIGYESIEEVQLKSFLVQNAAAKEFMIGESTPIDQVFDLNGMTFALSSEDVLLGEAKSSDAMGDQWEALLFLINQRIEMGMTIEPKQVLITGSLGRLFPFETGSYFADFGDLGQLSFYIK